MAFQLRRKKNSSTFRTNAIIHKAPERSIATRRVIFRLEGTRKVLAKPAQEGRGSRRKRQERLGVRRRTVRAAEDPCVEGRLAVEPIWDVEAAAHAQPPRPGLLPVLPAPAAASLVARAPHGLLPRRDQPAALPSAWPRATRLYRSAANLSPQPPRRDLYLVSESPARRPRARDPELEGARRNGTFRAGFPPLAAFELGLLGHGMGLPAACSVRCTYNPDASWGFLIAPAACSRRRLPAVATVSVSDSGGENATRPRRG
jgi:hypothetical protein